MLRLLFVCGLVLCLSSCTGYKLGGSRPSHLKTIESLSIPLAENKTLIPRAGVLTTNSAVDALTRDGSYRLDSTDHADATLHLTVRSVKYRQLRSVRTDTLRPNELDMLVTLSWRLEDNAGAKEILDEGKVTASSRGFVSGNLQKDRDNTFPDALRRATEGVIARLSSGY